MQHRRSSPTAVTCSGSVKLAMVMKSFQPRLVLSPVLMSAAKRPKESLMEMLAPPDGPLCCG